MDAEKRNELIRLAKEYDKHYKEAGIQPAPSMDRESNLKKSVGLDPWKQDAFDPFHGPNRGNRRRPSQVPDSRMLFDIQKDMLRAIDAQKDSDHEESARQLRNGYRLLNRYLRQYVTNPQGQQDNDATSF